jgi:putative transposase
MEIATQAETLDDLNGLIKLMMKSALERMLDTEMDVHLARKMLPGSTADFRTPVAAKRIRGTPP